MMKTCALTCVIGWAAAVAFGWIALATPKGESTTLLMTNMTLAALGAAVGLVSWLRLRNASC